MNIPAELVDIANTCDLYGLNQEADTLTSIASMMMQNNESQKPMRNNLDNFIPPANDEQNASLM